MLNKILDIINSIFGVAENATDPTQYDIKRMKKLEYRIEAGMQYVFAVEQTGKYSDMSDAECEKWKRHWRKRIFDV